MSTPEIETSPLGKQPLSTRDYLLAGLRFRLSSEEGKLRVQSITPTDAPAGEDVNKGRLGERVPVLVHLRGAFKYAHFGARSIHSESTMALELRNVAQDGPPESGSLRLVFEHPATQLEVAVHYQAFGPAAPGAVRVTAEAHNRGPRPVVIEQFLICLPGLGRPSNPRWGSTTAIHVAQNTWLGEAQWNVFLPSQLGIADTVPVVNDMPDTWPCFSDPLGAAVWRNIGTWSTINYLPMGVIEDKDSGLSWFWQIEHSGSWQMEVGRAGHAFYLAAGLPSMNYGDWYITLSPGESYAAAPVGFGCARGGFEQAISTLHGYRRQACLPGATSPDAALPFIFNDCMQCLCANPTLQNSRPVIAAAAWAGAEYYVIDAGWFDPKAGPQCLGDWRESADRFGEAGFKGLCGEIRAKGMKVGIWVEIECVSAAAELFKKPDSWFICSNGTRVMSFDRYFLNFANPEVRAYAHEVMDRLCRDYGMAYLKLDYNADAGLGDNQAGPSHGAGQVEAYRGFFQWLEELRARHPDLIVENCGSGGQRFDYGLLSRTHLQSTSDTNDPYRYPSIMTGSLAAALPEQAAVWSCPHGNQDDETVALNLVTPMLARWHLAGRVDHLTDFQRELVLEAVALWKGKVRIHLAKMVPFWPLPPRHLHEQDAWIAVGLRNAEGTHAFLNVYRLDHEDATFTVPLSSLQLARARVRTLFPSSLPSSAKLDAEEKRLTVQLPRRFSGRFIEIASD